MPVQPMKSIAAVALVEALNRQQVTAAGVWMGIFLVLLSLGAIEWVNRLVPLAVVSGMQVGVGCSLAIKGFHIISDLTWIDNVDCILLAVLCALLSLFFLREPAADENSHIINIDQPEIDHHSRRRREHRHLPAVGLYLFSLGAVIAVLKIFLQDDDDSRISWNSGRSIAVWALQNTSWSDWKMGLLEGALPQLPLSTLVRYAFACWRWQTARFCYLQFFLCHVHPELCNLCLLSGANALPRTTTRG